ncbi:unnamed protein product [Protopolystoma xenopodis]|uniref:Uncharacterized protein n=1 Tax=Protopolystoma xenopodis TaxID=117903 RepID=A0A3S5A034_9PLAT|nr:unnamed protein product [Protopolystoma xenopodis]
MALLASKAMSHFRTISLILPLWLGLPSSLQTTHQLHTITPMPGFRTHSFSLSTGRFVAHNRTNRQTCHTPPCHLKPGDSTYTSHTTMPTFLGKVKCVKIGVLRCGLIGNRRDDLIFELKLAAFPEDDGGFRLDTCCLV